jgi:hypothetical protein
MIFFLFQKKKNLVVLDDGASDPPVFGSALYREKHMRLSDFQFWTNQPTI